MMRRFACILAALASHAAASAHMGAVMAEEVDYDGRELFLSGGVKVDYDEGSLTAGKAHFTNPCSGRPWQFRSMELGQGVLLALDDGSSLQCDNAHFDEEQQLAVFYGGKEVLFSSGGEGPPLLLKGLKMDALLQPKGGAGLSFFNSTVSTLIAEGSVVATYCYDAVATGNRATFRRQSGLLTMEAGGEERCVVTNSRGDRVEADRIDLETLRRRLSMNSAVGEICYGGDPFAFEGERVLFDEKNEKVSIEGRSLLRHELLGIITAEERIELTAGESEGELQLKKIEGWGKMRFEQELRQLCCDGTAVIDCIEGRALFTKGVEQVRYTDSIGELYADQAVLEFERNEGLLTPVRLLLTGHVKMINNILVPQEAVGKPLLQYALADRLELLPRSGQATLSMEAEKGRILFFDKINQITMSATGMVMKRSGKTGSKEIRGIGDVRFRFFECEMNELKQRFKFECLNLG